MNFAFKTIHQFNDYFKDEKTCYDFYEQVRWNGVPVCPHCGSEKHYKVKARGKFQDIPSYRCANRECDLPFTVRTKSIFEGSKVEFRKWLQAVYEISTCKNGISSVELSNRIGVSQKTAWFINHRLRAMLQETDPTQLCDVVEVDETNMGGKNKNRHADKKVQGGHGGKSGKDKTIVFGARGLGGKVRTKVIPNVELQTIRPLINKWIKPGSIMVSDELAAYTSLKDTYFHVSVVHSKGQYVTGAFSTNGVENFWSLFKRGVVGTFHRISRRHCQLYADEFANRYNQKDVSNVERFGNAIRKTPNVRLTYRNLTGQGGTIGE